MANLLPDGLLAGWNSSHDNGFVWLTLIEAIALPVVLCTVDSRLARALRRSLSCRASTGFQHGGAANTYSTRVTSSGSSNLLKRPPTGTGTRLAHFNELQRAGKPPLGNELVLGPSASYPDFMFVCPPTKLSLYAAATELRGAGSGQKLAPVGSLTGPPYPLLMPIGARSHEQPLAIDTGLRDTNFALGIKPALRTGASILGALNATGSAGADCIGTADLMASRRARYAELMAGPEKGRSRKQRTRACRGVGRSAGSALLCVTRRLLSFGRPGGLGKRRQARSNPSSAHNKYGYSAASNSSSAATEQACGTLARPEMGAGSSGSGGRGMSPTSSLSTLIRKFNHDNYTSVCQQYEQRKKEIACEQEKCNTLESLAEADDAMQASSMTEALLIDGLDGPSGEPSSNRARRRRAGSAAPPDDEQANNRCLLDEEGVFCRKGGLCYNYCLNSDSANDFIQLEERAAPRLNPMLHAAGAGSGSGGGKSLASLNKAAGRASAGQPAEDKARIDCAAGNKPLLPADAFQTKQSGSAPAKPAGTVDARQPSSAAKRNSIVVVVDGKQQLDPPNEDSKTTQAIFMVPVERIGELAATGAGNNEPAEPHESADRATGESTPAKSAATNQAGRLKEPINNNNNEPIISNITSVQELLDKMNGIIGGQAESTKPDGHGSSTSTNNNRAGNNKAILKNFQANKGSGGNDKQASTCVDQLRQLELALATSGRHNQNQNHSSTGNEQGSNTNTLDRADYASLRSIEDTLSLVSVSSEFEYHNINGAPTTGQNPSKPIGSKSGQIVTASATDGAKRWPESKQVVEYDLNSAAKRRPDGEALDVGCKQQQQRQVNASHANREWLRTAPISPVEINSNTTTSIEAAAKRLDDLRFPSFLPTKAKFNQDSHSTETPKPVPLRSPNTAGSRQQPAKPAEAVKPLSKLASRSGSSSSCSSGSTNNLAQQQATPSQPACRLGSSSLLNLTSAKFAAAAAQQRSPNAPSGQPNQLGRLLPARSAVSSNTITKQRAKAARSGVLVEEQAGSRRVGAPAVTLVELASQQSERSLPSEGGHVRARIRKMEQQQSTPNLNMMKPSQPKPLAAYQQPSASGRPGHLAGSLIPVTRALAGKSAVGNTSNKQASQRLQSGAARVPLSHQRHLAGGDSSANSQPYPQRIA